MAYKKKYKKGREILSMTGLVTILKRDKFVMVHYGAHTFKPSHEGFILSLPFRVVLSFLNRGRIYRVLKNKEAEDVK